MAKRQWCCCLGLLLTISLNQADLISPLDQLKNHYQQLEKPDNLLVVFDIDDTILSNKLIINSDYGYDLYRVIGFQRLSKLPLMSEQNDIYQWCLQNNIGVVFITFRCETERLQTIKNLREQNLNQWDKLILFPEPCDYQTISAKEYKTDARKKLTESGFNILAAIGDQYSDIHGGYTDLSIKLDDPGYYTK